MYTVYISLSSSMNAVHVALTIRRTMYNATSYVYLNTDVDVCKSAVDEHFIFTFLFINVHVTAYSHT